MTLNIYRDGSVVLKEHGEEPRIVDRENEFALAECFRCVVEFEEGLTAGELMKALLPWGRLLSAAAWCDFTAWASAMQGAWEPDPDEYDRLSRIEIVPVIDVFRYEDGSEASLGVNWQVRGRYETPQQNLAGYPPDETCSVSFCDPAMLGALPVVIVREASVMDLQAMGPDALPPVIAPSGEGSHAALACEPGLFDAVVMGFLDDISFHGTPETTEARLEDLKQSIQSIEDGTAELVEWNPGGK